MTGRRRRATLACALGGAAAAIGFGPPMPVSAAPAPVEGGEWQASVEPQSSPEGFVVTLAYGAPGDDWKLGLARMRVTQAPRRCSSSVGDKPVEGAAVDGEGDPAWPAYTARPGVLPLESPGEPVARNFRFSTLPACNGEYSATITAIAQRPGGELCSQPLPTETCRVDLDVRLHVAVPSPPVTKVTAVAGADRAVDLAWEKPSWKPDGADEAVLPEGLVGYEVYRLDAAGAAVGIYRVEDSGTTTVRDTSIPPGGGSFRYDVYAVRRAEDGDRLLVSSPASSGEPVVIPDVNPTTTTGPPPPPTDVEAGAVPGPGQVTSPPTTSELESETGFQSDLPYLGDPATAAEAEPGDAEASFRPNAPGANLVKPFAAAVVLGMWAMLALVVNRQAKAAEARLAPIKIERDPNGPAGGGRL